MIHGHTFLQGSSDVRRLQLGSLSIQDTSPFRLLGWQYLINIDPVNNVQKKTGMGEHIVIDVIEKREIASVNSDKNQVQSLKMGQG